jgi:uncharacterized membrane protein YebE (DUF533 family)
MLDPKHLLDQMLNGKVAGRIGEAGQLTKNRLNRASGAQGFAGGAVAGGLLGLLLGSKKMRKLASGALGYGGAAALGRWRTGRTRIMWRAALCIQRTR